MRTKKKDLLRFLLEEEITAKFPKKKIQGIFTFGYWQNGKFVGRANPSLVSGLKEIKKPGYYIIKSSGSHLPLSLKSKYINYKKSSFEEKTLILENN